MASLCGSCASEAACCCGSSMLSLCCKSCPGSCHSSTATRIFYATLFTLSSIAAWLLLVPDIAQRLQKMSKYTGHVACKDGDKTCDQNWGQLGVDRVFFGVAVFHAALALVLVGVKSSADARSKLQNGWWLFKFVLLAGLVTAAFFINNHFFVAFGWIGLVGAFLFIIVQLILLVDFAHSWNEGWVAKLEDGETCYKWALLAVTFLLYAGVLILTILCFVFYAGKDCQLSQFFIAFNLVLCIVVTAASIHPAVQERMPTSGLLQAGVVSFYTTYLTWSAVAGMPGHCSEGLSSSTAATVVGALLTFVAVAYSSVRMSSRSQLGQLGMGASTEESTTLLPTSSSSSNNEDGDDSKIQDNEQDGVIYSWSFFHLTFLLAAFYMMEVINEWATIKDSDTASVEVGEGKSAVWVKVVSSWVAILLYGWTLVAPLCLPDRDFGY